MIYGITRNRLSIALFVVALTTAVFWIATSSSQPASARIGDGSVRFISTSIFGMALGETVRVCIGTTDPRGPVLDWFVRLSDQEGTLLFQLPEQRSPAGEWRCGDIARSMLPVAGDAGTGRVQVAMEVLVKAPAGTKASEIEGAADIVTAPGTTSVHLELRMHDTLISTFSPSSSTP